MITPEALVVPFAFAVGAIVGSFANVCIHRLPRGESVVSPPSHCPACGRPVAARDNVPILGWLLLRGRCRSCGAAISARYPLVELLVAVLFAACAWIWGASPQAVAAAVLSACCVILIATDLESRILPDEVTIGGLVLGAAIAAWRGAIEGGAFDSGFLFESLLGAALGAGVLMAIRISYKALRGAEGMGLGDVKMIAMIGAFTGPSGVLVSLFFGSLSGALLGSALVARRSAGWGRARSLLAAGDVQAAARAGGGAVLDSDGRLAATGARWREVPGSAQPGSPPALARPVGAPLLALLRLGRRRARRGQSTFTNRLVLEDDDFFRVLAARVESVGGRLLLLLSRADIPFGVFLALGGLAAYAFGRAALQVIFGALPIPAARLLP